MSMYDRQQENVRRAMRTGARRRVRSRRALRLACLTILLLQLTTPWSASAREYPVAQADSQAQVGVARAIGQLHAVGHQLPLQAATATPTTAERLAALATQLDAAWNAQDWEEVLSLIAQIKAIDPSYDNISEREYYAQVNYGYALLTEGQCTAAKAAFVAALALRAGGEEAEMGLQLVSTYCATPVPSSPTPTTTTTPGASATSTPVVSATPTSIVLTAPITYTVQLGDTLYSLAKRYGTTVQAIMQANGLTSTFLRSGQLIWIPNEATPSVGPIVHIVQPGETLYSIARLYNTTVWSIVATNRLTSTSIWAYRVLYIPSTLEDSLIAHVVMPGDTLYTIAEEYDTTVPLLMLANNLTDYSIYVYQKLVIPPDGWTGWPTLWPDSWAGESTHPGTSGTVYVVRSGDTLYSIATYYGVTVAALKSANGLTSDRIYVGMKLTIP